MNLATIADDLVAQGFDPETAARVQRGIETGDYVPGETSGSPLTWRWAAVPPGPTFQGTVLEDGTIEAPPNDLADPCAQTSGPLATLCRAGAALSGRSRAPGESACSWTDPLACLQALPWGSIALIAGLTLVAVIAVGKRL